MTDSSAAGYLSPVLTTPPITDEVLLAAFQQCIVGITGLPGALVRERWQTSIPKQPDPSVNWVSFGIITTTTDDNAAIDHNGDLSQDIYARHQEIELLTSFYGPNSEYYAQLLIDGLAIAQNRDALKINLINFVNSATMRNIPELVNQQWIQRKDLPLFFRRKIERQYQVLNVDSANVGFLVDASQGIIQGNIEVINGETNV